MLKQIVTLHRRPNMCVAFLLIAATLVVTLLGISPVTVRADSADTTQTLDIGESRDFATLVLRDPWDMDKFSDISQYLNESGQRRVLGDVRVQNGIFSATSLGTAAEGNNGYFFPLFTGYETTVKLGKVGHNYPIASDDYRCLYIAMKVDSGPANSMGPDQFVVYWFEDSRLVQRGGLYGVTGGIPLYPEVGGGQPTHSWRLYRVNLDDPPHGLRPDTRAAWDARPLWRGIRIDPTINRNVKFAVDWVRLTPCAPNTHALTWPSTPTGNALWVRASGTDHYIRVATGVNGASGSHNLDVQGITPGRYTVALGTETTCCVRNNVGVINIHQRPIVEFDRPSFTSGEDYHTAATGRPWDFERESDVRAARNFERTWFENDQFHMITAAGPLPDGLDAQFDLNVPTSFSTQEYRFFTFRMYTEWVSPWQDVTSGMIARLVWTMPSLTGQGGYECQLVTQDLPYDVGWNTYTVDLHDWFAGGPEAQYPIGPPHCPPLASRPQEPPPTNIDNNSAHWLNTGPVVGLRFDPNENVSCEFGERVNPAVPCSDYYQILDWMRLTKVDGVPRGTPYPVHFEVTGPSEDAIVSLNYFYTTNRNNPRQNQANAVRVGVASGDETPVVPGATLNPSSAHMVFLPMTSHRASASNPGGPGDINPGAADFLWDTTAVARGTYYICVEASTTYGAAIHCSDAPMQIR